jgi:hypothetical protein
LGTALLTPGNIAAIVEESEHLADNDSQDEWADDCMFKWNIDGLRKSLGQGSRKFVLPTATVSRGRCNMPVISHQLLAASSK